MRWLRGIRDGAALVRLAVKQPPQPVVPNVYYLDPDYATMPDPPVLKRSSVVPYTAGGFGCLLLLTLVVAGMFLVFAQPAYESERLTALGAETAGTVIDCVQTKGNNHWLTYRYTVREQGISQSYEGGSVTYQCDPPGTAMVVRYLPDNPRISRPKFDQSFTTARTNTLLGAILFGLVLIYFLRAVILSAIIIVRSSRRYHILLERGIMLPGTVMDGRWKGEGRRKERIVEYEFMAPDGTLVRGKMTDAPDGYLDLPLPGMAVKIVYADARNHVML